MTDLTLADWLKAQDLDQYAPTFAEHEVDLATLRVLTDADLKEIGLPFGPRKRILSLLADEKRLAEPAAATGPMGERRQLTVLFCDMVGFTDLAFRLDPEILQGVIQAYEETCAACINRYDGYVFTCLGDGVVAFFGFPLAHEGEAERAIRASLDIIEAMSQLKIPEVGPLQVRVGIATGMVVVASGERNAVGETMNLASRLQTVAEPGSIVVSERVRRLAEGEFDYEDLGEKDLKGVTGLTRVYRVAGVSTVASRFEAATHGGMTPLVGRDDEIDVLMDRWATIERDHVGQAVLLIGEAGIGKSRIVNALCAELRTRSARELLFQCSPFYANSAFYPLIASLERSLGIGRDAEPAARLDQLEALLVGQLGLPQKDLPFIAAMLSIPFQDRYGAISISPKLAKAETIRILVEIVRAQARSGPMLLLFEDAHWADPTSLDVLGSLVDQLADLPILLVVSGRPEFESPWTGRNRVTGLDLGKLSPAQSRALITEVAGGRSLPAELVGQIITKTDGVPLFVEELTKAILESGDLVLEGDHYAYAGAFANVAIPETLRDLLMSRLDRVASTKRIAQVGSVVGREFSYEVMAALDLMDKAALDDALERLTQAGLASKRGSIPSAIYTFSHALVQDAAYDSLLKSQRKPLHGQIARLLEERWPETRDATPELLAYHHTAADQGEAAAPLWLRAGEVAIQRFALPEAITHLHTGMTVLEALPPSPERDQMELSVRAALGPALVAHRGWGFGEVSEILEPAWDLAQSLERRSAYLPILNALSVHYMCVDQLVESLRWADRLLQTGADIDDDSLVIVGHRAASACHHWLAEFERARKSGDQVHALYDAERHWHLAQLTNTDPFTGEGIYRPQFLWMLGYPDQALKANAAAEANARRRAHPFDLAFELTLGAQVFDFLGDSAALLARTEEAERIGREYGLALLGEIMVEISRGVALLRAGRADESVALLDQGIGRLMRTGHRIWIWYLRALQAEGMALTGDLAGADALITESLSRIEQGEERSHYAEVLRLKGWLLILQGKPEAAEASLRAAIEVAQRQQARSWELRVSTTLAGLLADRGDPAAAVALLDPIHAWFTEGANSKDLVAARDLLADLRAVGRSRSLIHD